jgi:hypothetical protein
MKTYLRTILTLCWIITSLTTANGQDSIPKVLNFFLDCDDCDFNFVREELPFIAFVRDPQLADVHILVTDSQTGSGGNKYFLNFIGLKAFNGVNYEYTVITKQDDTDDDIRNSLLKFLKIGILPYYSKTSFIDNLSIDLEESENRAADDMVFDRWNKWLFRISSGGEFHKEESQNGYLIDTEASAEKITEEWKTSFEASYEIKRENYYDDGEEITNRQDSKRIDAEFIKSLNEKWSAGIFGGYSSKTYLNIENKYGASAGIEYNIFPWKECNRRVFAIRYSAGYNFVDYIEETIYDKMSESLWNESVGVNIEFIQPWGEVSVGLTGSQYFHDFSKNRLTLEGDFSIRLTRNLSVFFEIQSQLVHDQLYLPKGDASLEDVLLERRKLATTYEIGGQLGFRFTFGSIYNNVVNERF